jgi:hypothetical protein
MPGGILLNPVAAPVAPSPRQSSGASKIRRLFLGSGIPLFDRIDPDNFERQILGPIHSPMVTHLRYGVKRKA